MGDVAAIGIVRRSDLGPGLLWPPVHARRCLFGPPDPGCARTLLENETKILEQKSRERWNFDFVEGKPLNGGRYVWTPVSEDAAANEPVQEKDENQGSKEPKEKQSLITDFMRKRKLSSNQKETMTPESKTRRRFST